MTEKKSTGPEEGIKGVVEDVKGKAKEAVGTVAGRDDLVREGKAQQDKADAQKDVAKKEAAGRSLPALAPRLPRSARRRTSGRRQFERKRAQPGTPAGPFSCVASCWVSVAARRDVLRTNALRCGVPAGARRAATPHR